VGSSGLRRTIFLRIEKDDVSPSPCSLPGRRSSPRHTKRISTADPPGRAGGGRHWLQSPSLLSYQVRLSPWYLCQHIASDVADLIAVDALDGRKQLNVLQSSQRVKQNVLLWTHSQQRADGREVGVEGHAFDDDLPVRGGTQPRQHAHKLRGGQGGGDYTRQEEGDPSLCRLRGELVLLSIRPSPLHR
jgi:hypothetical protein